MTREKVVILWFGWNDTSYGWFMEIMCANDGKSKPTGSSDLFILFFLRILSTDFKYLYKKSSRFLQHHLKKQT